MARSHLTTPQRDRAAGVLVALACGDALGVPYEFGSPLTDERPAMIGGGLGPYAPGEWSDDTQMAICVARVSAEADELDDAALTRIGHAFSDWLRTGATDAGNQTRAVLGTVETGRASSAPDETSHQDYVDAARSFTRTHERSAGNGALMRNGIVGLTALDNRELTAANARRIAELTHADPLVLDSCVLHAETIRHAVLTGEYDIAAGLDLLPEERRGQWREWLESATLTDPSTIDANGSTFGALRAAHAAITRTRVLRYSTFEGGNRHHARAAIEAAASAGNDTDTVAAITGAMVGALYGVSAIPATWRRRVHGWPGMRARDLVTLALRTATSSAETEWPLQSRSSVPHGRSEVPLPFDTGVLLGSQSRLHDTQADAVVSLSRIGVEDRLFSDAAPENHVEFWLVDSDDRAQHNDLAASLEDAADTLAELRAEGHTVLLHCVHAHHRTPSVALIYGVKHCGLGVDEAEHAILSTLDVPSISGLLWDTASLIARRAQADRRRAQEISGEITREPKGWYDDELTSLDDVDSDLSPVYVASMMGDISSDEYALWFNSFAAKAAAREDTTANRPVDGRGSESP